MNKIIIGQAERLVQLQNLLNNTKEQEAVILSFSQATSNLGKDFVVYALANALSNLKKNVLLVDISSNLNNIFNNSEGKFLETFFANKHFLKDVIWKHNDCLSIATTSATDERNFVSLTDADYLMENINKIQSEYDYILFNNPAGITDTGVFIAASSTYNVLITSTSVTDIMDAYSVVKIFKVSGVNSEILVFVNNSENYEEANLAFVNLNQASNHFLKRTLKYLGTFENQFSSNQQIMNISYKPIQNSFKDIAYNLVSLTNISNSFSSNSHFGHLSI